MTPPVLVIVGASGPVGRHLVRHAMEDGFDVRLLSRQGAVPSKETEKSSPRGDGPRSARREPTVFHWNPTLDTPPSVAPDAGALAALEGAFAVVNLAGSSLADGSLDVDHAMRLIDSRIAAARTLGRAWAATTQPPRVWVQASAIGIYGHAGEAELTEGAPGAIPREVWADLRERDDIREAFSSLLRRDQLVLPLVCPLWEQAAADALRDAVRSSTHDATGEGVVNAERESTFDSPTAPFGATPDPTTSTRFAIARIGLVLAKDAPAWQKMTAPIRWGLGGPIAGGQQWMSWIHAHDVARALLFIIHHREGRGIFHLTAPHPVRQADFSAEVAQRLGRPSALPTPAFLLRLVAGRAADELVLPSAKVLPRRLAALGFHFQRPTLASALDELLTVD